MASGTATIGETPCCGVIERTWEATPSKSSPTGMWHVPGGAYAPDFQSVAFVIESGRCPDCGHRFRPIGVPLGRGPGGDIEGAR